MSYLVVFPEGKCEIFEWEDVKYPATKVKDAIAIIHVDTYSEHPLLPKNNVYLKAYYRAGHIDLLTGVDSKSTADEDGSCANCDFS